MTREEQLVFCKMCTNRKMDVQYGLVCGLTGDKAAFQVECPDFMRDDTVTEARLDDMEGLATAAIEQKLSPEIIERLRMEQRLIPGLVSGMIVGILGAFLWGLITVATGYQIGYMALAIGAGVGLTIRKFGNGIDPVFGIFGGGISLISVFLGNFFSIIGFVVTNTDGLGFEEILLQFDFSYLPTLMAESFSVIDLLFYGIAVYEGYKFSFRKITEKMVMDLKQKRSYI